ncbi:aminotransferase class I/II-fold pyridoxal phosphate-dependent enzyme [Streptomyces griseus]|uniref:aminotransferase class I/II-fold pyridoxal phosphate-dependent enzyme n=2 Tax=Streptomyces griseus TaxID=1911 RepID=UPI000849C390|nr:aminotransferase class I/II-fold pyridoxal phosphate-dependent enzyme [Streptomyces griseus]SEE25760.1 Aminotransferase class I and II [Streptomyces griseus]SQA27315.1 tyrosine/nicotianamine family aminotransferase [Streptomyces griseus]
MHDTIPAPAQADCLTAFGALRDGAAPDTETAIELGEGCNRFPPSPDLARYLSALLDRFIRDGTLSAYASRSRAGARAAMAELLGNHLNMRLDPSDIFFTRGGTEAISLTIAHLSETGHALILPLPNYYAFDQCAVRWGAPVTGYYRHDGTLHPTSTSPLARTCLVEVLPNGVTGARHTPPARAEPDFTLLDVPFQIGAEGPQPAAILRDRVHGIDLGKAALILTASKDLSLPGLRAAVVITRNEALLQHLARDRFERMAMSGDPVGEVVMIFYACLLTVVEAPHEQTAKLVRIAQDSVSRAGLAALPKEETYRRIRDHLTVMAERFRQNAHALDGPGSPVRRIPGMEPVGGYSAFAELRIPQERFLPWVTLCGRAGLRLNPTVVHGGTSAAWDALYPGGQLLRLNLSETPGTFQRGLDMIRLHARRPAPAQGLRKERSSP